MNLDCLTLLYESYSDSERYTPHAWASGGVLVVYIWGVTQMGVLMRGLDYFLLISPLP